MKSSELVNELRKLLSPKVDYAKLVCAEPFSYGCCYVWEDPEPYIIENAANVIESQQAEIDRLKHENEQLRELVRLAVEDMNNIDYCQTCTEQKVFSKQCLECECKCNWRWQHADKLKEMVV